MTNPWDRPPLPKEGDADQDTTYAAVGRVLSAWEAIEGELSNIFAIFIGKMWTAEAYDDYRAKGKTTHRRLETIEKAAKVYFVKMPNQQAEGAFCRLVKYAKGFADRRHEVAHGIVRPLQWYGSLLPNVKPPIDGRPRYCLVPPHYQRDWFANGVPEYIYTSNELNEIEDRLLDLFDDVMDYRHHYVFTPSPPHS